MQSQSFASALQAPSRGHTSLTLACSCRNAYYQDLLQRRDATDEGQREVRVLLQSFEAKMPLPGPHLPAPPCPTHLFKARFCSQEALGRIRDAFQEAGLPEDIEIDAFVSPDSHLAASPCAALMLRLAWC